MNSSSSIDQSAATSQASGSTSGETRHGNKQDRKTGLDRADEVAGEHGRDNARAKQGG